MLISKVLWQIHDALRNDVELHFGGAQQPLALRFGTGQPLSYQALSNPGQLDEGAQALRLEARADGWQLANGQRLPSAPVTLALTAHVLQYDPAGGPSRLYDHHGQLLRQLDFSLPALRVNSRLQLQPLGEGQLLAIQSGYPPFVVELSDGRISRALVAESDQPLAMAQGLSDGHVLAVHDTGAGDGELFIWQPPHLPAAVAVLAAQLASRSGESSADYTSRLSGISAGYCGRVYPLHYDNISGVYSLEWQGAEVTLVVAAHARPGRQQRLELCGSLHPLGTDQLELRDISLRAR